MKITKYGHSCMLIEEGEVRILIDPGAWSGDEFKKVKNIDAILITHEHQDHTDLESIKILVANNPSSKIYTNKGVGKVLEGNQIAYELLEQGQKTKIKSVLIEAFGEKHAIIHSDFPIVDDTGYLIAERFFYSGDAFHIPSKPVEILGLPVVAPWMRLAEAIDYAQKIKPTVCFPVHDGFLKFPGPFYSLPAAMLSKASIEFKVLEEGKEYDFV